MRIINFDGIRASGKSSQLSLLVKFLLGKNLRNKLVHEKDYEPLRSLALYWSNNPKPFSHNVIKDFAKARAEIYRKEVSPIIKEIDYLIFD